jgi:hypothetical protein
VLVFTVMRTSIGVGLVTGFVTTGFVTVDIVFAPMDNCRWEEQHEYLIFCLTKMFETYFFERIVVLN